MVLGILVGAGHYFAFRYFYANILHDDVPVAIHWWLLGGFVFGMVLVSIYTIFNNWAKPKSINDEPANLN